jgi:hypothetical protein
VARTYTPPPQSIPYVPGVQEHNSFVLLHVSCRMLSYPKVTSSFTHTLFFAQKLSSSTKTVEPRTWHPCLVRKFRIVLVFRHSKQLDTELSQRKCPTTAPFPPPHWSQRHIPQPSLRYTPLNILSSLRLDTVTNFLRGKARRNAKVKSRSP